MSGTPDGVQLRIEDNGVGMDRETVKKAFTLFFSSKGASGTGLGLFIAHKITEAHGGTIELESEPGVGTRVTVTLPWSRPPQDDEDLPMNPAFAMEMSDD